MAQANAKNGEGSGENRQPIAFISHHSSQVDAARHLANALKQQGIKGWMAPDDIDPGQPFDRVIIEKIAESDVILLLFCSRSDQSKHVKREIMLAEQEHKLIFPIRLETIQPQGLAYWLQDYQWIDWLDKRDDAIERMVRTIRNQLNLPAEAEEVQPEEKAEEPAPAAAAPAPAAKKPAAKKPAAKTKVDDKPAATAPPPPPPTPPKSPEPEPAMAAAATASTLDDPEPERARMDKKTALILGGVGAVGLAGIAGIALYNGSDTPEDLKDVDTAIIEDGFTFDDGNAANPAAEMPEEAVAILTDKPGASAPMGAIQGWQAGMWNYTYTGPDGGAVQASECLSEAQAIDPIAYWWKGMSASMFGSCAVGSAESINCYSEEYAASAYVYGSGYYTPGQIDMSYQFNEVPDGVAQENGNVYNAAISTNFGGTC